METIVPGLHGSGRNDESYDGLPSLLAASSGGERTIAGTVGACSAGAPTLNAPAKEREDANMASNALRIEKEKMHSPVRLRGGGKRLIMPFYSSEEEDQLEEEEAEHQVSKKRKGNQEMAFPGSNNEPIPGPSGQGRSRSPINERSRLRRTASRSKPHRPTATDEESSSTIEILSEDYSSPRAVLKQERQSPVIMGSSDREKVPKLPPKPIEEAQSAEDSYSSTMEEGSTEPKTKRRRKKKKMRMGTTAKEEYKPDTVVPNIEELRANAAGKRGRPPTTGQYCKLAENKKAFNDEKEREHRLELERRVFSMEETLDILKKARLDPEDKMDEASLAPTAVLANDIREAQAEIVRISKVSSNLKGTFQKALKAAASITLTGLEILRTRADTTAERTGSEEMRKMREQSEKLREKLSSAQISMDAKLIELREEVEKARELARTETIKKERAMKQLKDALSQNVALQKMIAEEKEKIRAEKSKVVGTGPRHDNQEPMELEIVPPSTPSAEREESAPASTARQRISARDWAEYPIIRPAIKGKTSIVPEVRRNLPPPEREEDVGNERVSSKKKRGLKGPNWGGMEYYSSASQPEIAEIEDKGREKGESGRKHPESTPTPAPRSNVTYERHTKETKKEEAPTPLIGRQDTVQSSRRGRTEAQKAKRREHRRKKRQEAAQRRAEALHPAQGPPGSHPKRNNQGARPQVGDSGPASRTRARTRETAKADIRVPRVTPPAPKNEELPIKDVRIPPDDWVPVRRRRERSGARPTYAEAVRGAPPSDPIREKGGRDGQSAGSRPASAPRQQQRGANDAQKGRRSQQPLVHKKPPRTAAVQITCPPCQSAETMRLTRERVDIKGLGIEELRPRRARTEALLLEISGTNGAAKADALAREMQEALCDREGVIISRPIKMAELRLKDIEESVSTVEITEAVALEGECQEREVKIGPIRLGTNGLGTVWIRCPLTAANRLARKGHLRLGWTRARIELLPERPATCFRCLQAGHVRATCPGNEDRSDLCYRCGVAGHLARECAASPRCLLCIGTGRGTNHRVGSRACRAPREKGTRRVDGRRTGERIHPTTQQGPELMDVVTEPEPEPLPQLSQPIRPITERGPEPRSGSAPFQPSQPVRPVIGKEREKTPLPAPRRPVETAAEGELAMVPPQSPQRDWPAEGEEWGPDAQAQRKPKMKCRVLDIQTLHLKVTGPSGAVHSTPPPTGKTPVILGHREVECEEEEEEVDEEPTEAAGGTTIQKGHDEAPQMRETQGSASKGGGCPDNH